MGWSSAGDLLRGMSCLFRIHISEKFVRGLHQTFFRQIPFGAGGDAAKNLDGRLVLLGGRKGVKGVQNLANGGGHGTPPDWRSGIRVMVSQQRKDRNANGGGSFGQETLQQLQAIRD